MPEILDLEISRARLALRIVLSIIVGAIIFIALYLIPANPTLILDQLEQFLPLPKEAGQVLTSLSEELIDPAVPILGLLLTTIIPIGIILGKTKAHGPLIIITNVLLAYFLYTLFRGGLIDLSLPPGLPLGLTGQVRLEIQFIVQIILLPPILNVIKGVLVTVDSLKSRQEL